MSTLPPIDPTLASIVTGVVTNGLTSFLEYAARKTSERAIGKDLLEKWKLDEIALRPLLQKVTNEVANTAQWQDQAQLEVVCLFLRSSEVQNILRQLFSVELVVRSTGDDSEGNVDAIKQEFSAALAIFMAAYDMKIPQAKSQDVDSLFALLVQACTIALDLAIDRGVLSAHEAKSNLRFQILRDEISNVRENLKLLTSREQPRLEMIKSFEADYRLQVAYRHGFITPPNFDSVRKLPIDDLYVAPNLLRSPLRNDKKRQRTEHALVDLDAFQAMVYRAIILGNPGGGKSTLALKLCHDLASSNSGATLAGREVTPILVILRDYGAEKKARRSSILDFIRSRANSDYQVVAPNGAFEYLLLNGRAVVIFDGLDELLDTSYRQEIASDVETFCSRFPSVPVIVTSREVGYEQAPLDERMFEVYRLAPFDERQVNRYVENWFGTDRDLSSEQQAEKATKFLEESEIVPDLRSNPLMLALMCNIYRGESYIPRNRPEVYEKCATMLFDRWDKGRGINVSLSIEAHIRPTMQYLAHWIYSTADLRSGVTESRLVVNATEYLCEWRFDDPVEAEAAAVEFIRFCRGRAWVFTDTGTTREGERLYQFTHTTFLEYFTAAHLVRVHRTPSSLFEALLPRIERQEWDVVSQLAFQIQNKNVEGAGDELLGSLLDEAGNVSTSVGYKLLFFAARALEFLVPRRQLVARITTTCCSCAFALASMESQQRGQNRQLTRRGISAEGELLGSLLALAADENRAKIASTIHEFVSAELRSDNDQRQVLAAEFVLYITQLLHLMGNRKPSRQRIDFWQQFADAELRAHKDAVKVLASEHVELCPQAVRSAVLSLNEMVEFHRAESIFTGYPSMLMYDLIPGSVVEQLAYVLIVTHTRTQARRSRRELDLVREAGHILINSPTPWLRATAELLSGGPGAPPMFDLFLFQFRERNNQPSGEDLWIPDADCLFGAFALLAAIIDSLTMRQNDLQDRAESVRFVSAVKSSEVPLIRLLRDLILARFTQADVAIDEQTLQGTGLTGKQREFILNWATGNIELVQIISRHHRHQSNRRRFPAPVAENHKQM